MIKRTDVSRFKSLNSTTLVAWFDTQYSNRKKPMVGEKINYITVEEERGDIKYILVVGKYLVKTIAYVIPHQVAVRIMQDDDLFFELQLNKNEPPIAVKRHVSLLDVMIAEIYPDQKIDSWVLNMDVVKRSEDVFDYTLPNSLKFVSEETSEFQWHMLLHALKQDRDHSQYIITLDDVICEWEIDDGELYLYEVKQVVGGKTVGLRIDHSEATIVWNEEVNEWEVDLENREMLVWIAVFKKGSGL